MSMNDNIVFTNLFYLIIFFKLLEIYGYQRRSVKILVSTFTIFFVCENMHDISRSVIIADYILNTYTLIT